MISPTGKGIRTRDKWGSGRYNVSRGDRKHKGTDFICEPGQWVVCPIDEAEVYRVARPYLREGYSGLVLTGAKIALKLFYLEPIDDIVGEFVKQGHRIGIAQDISEKYPGMIPHIHLEVSRVDPEIFINMP